MNTLFVGDNAVLQTEQDGANFVVMGASATVISVGSDVIYAGSGHSTIYDTGIQAAGGSYTGDTVVLGAGTATVLIRNGIHAKVVGKYSEGGESVVDLINRDEVDLVINTPSGSSGRADGYEIRAATVAADKALFTTMAQLAAAVASIETIHTGYDVTSLQDYAREREAKL